MTIQRMTDIDLSGKRVLIREDLNVPVADGVVTSDARIQAALPTIRAALEAGAHGYIVKAGSPGRLLQTLNEVVGGGTPLDPQIAGMLLDALIARATS